MKKRRVQLVEAYTDESGHSGLHLFDQDQPWFWTGTLVSPFPVQERADEAVRALCVSVGQEVLHANRLGLHGIEPIAQRLIEILGDLNAQFVLAAIEKRHVASGKLADTVLDSTMNQAVSTLHYGAYALRLMLAQVIVDIMSAQDQEEFWQVYADADAGGLSRILSRLLKRFNSIPEVNARLRELIADALSWGAAHPQDLLDFQRSELDAPNLIAVSLLMDGLHDSLRGTDLKVGRFVHDEQQQFGRFIREWYALARRFTVPTHATAFVTDIRVIDTYRCEIEILSSKNAVGLQLIDTVLWLYRRSIGNAMRGFPACAALVEFVVDHAKVRTHSKAQLAQDAQSAYAEIMDRPIGVKALERGRKAMDQIERARKERIRSSS